MLAVGNTNNKVDAENMDSAKYKECIKILKETGWDATKVNKCGDTVSEMTKKPEYNFLIVEF